MSIDDFQFMSNDWCLKIYNEHLLSAFAFLRTHSDRVITSKVTIPLLRLSTANAWDIGKAREAAHKNWSHA